MTCSPRQNRALAGSRRKGPKSHCGVGRLVLPNSYRIFTQPVPYCYDSWRGAWHTPGHMPKGHAYCVAYHDQGKPGKEKPGNRSQPYNNSHVPGESPMSHAQRKLSRRHLLTLLGIGSATLTMSLGNRTEAGPHQAIPDADDD